MVSLKGLKVLRPGLHIGTIKKNRFEPSHALALWLFPEDAQVQKEVEPDGTEAVKYLKGETLTGDTGMSAPCEKGWVLICTGNVSLGWGKMAAGTIKNHYPKGLRWM
ncbi:MAG: RsmF rRNA methyltransferase first C-terminal domain-containing protein [Clostridium sp.]